MLTRFLRGLWSGLGVAVGLGVGVAFAANLTTFETDQPLSASAMNANFAAVEARLATVESALAAAHYPITWWEPENGAEQHGPGCNEVLLMPFANSYCALSLTQFEDIDETSEQGRCYVFQSGEHWKVSACVLNDNASDADVWCRARCVAWGPT